MLVLLVVLTVHRLTRLVTWDAFPPAAAFRAGVRERWGKGSWQDYLVRCPWCVSMYVAAVVCAATAWTVGLAWPVLVAAAASTVTGLVAGNLDAPPDDEDDE